jgi:hypothetical protein
MNTGLLSKQNLEYLFLLLLVILALPFLSLSSIMFNPADTGQNLTDNIMSYYSFNSNFSDLMTKRHLQQVGTVPYAPAKINNSVNLSNTNYLVNLSSFSNTSQIRAVTFWLRPYDISGAQYLVYISDVAGSNRLYFFLDNSGANLKAELDIGGGAQFEITTTQNLTAHNWYFVALTYGSAGAKLYLNNTEDGTSASTSVLVENLSIYVGNNHALTESATSQIDELTFYDSELNTTQLSYLYNSFSGVIISNSSVSNSTSSSGSSGSGSGGSSVALDTVDTAKMGLISTRIKELIVSFIDFIYFLFFGWWTT